MYLQCDGSQALPPSRNHERLQVPQESFTSVLRFLGRSNILKMKMQQEEEDSALLLFSVLRTWPDR